MKRVFSRLWWVGMNKAEGLAYTSVGQHPVEGINAMSPLQGFRFFAFQRRALPYAIECRPFRAGKAKGEDDG